MKPSVDMVAFKRLRTSAFCCYYFGALFGGMLETIFFSTEYQYIKDTIKSSQPAIYFGIGTAVQNVSAMVAAFIGSMYYDRTRRIRQQQIFTCVCIIIASAFYILPYSVWLVISGNFFYGFICINSSAVMAELVHVYPEQEITGQVAIFGSLFAVGLVSGLALAYLFVLVDAKVGSWSLGFGNMPALVIGSLYFLYIFFILRLVQNLTLIYDPKQDFEEQSLLESEDEADCKNKMRLKDDMKLLWTERDIDMKIWLRSYLRIAYQVMFERHFGILLLTTGVATFSHLLFLGIIVVKASDVLHWEAQEIANLRIIMASGVIIASLLIKVCSRCMHDYYMLLGSVVFTVVALCALGLLPFVSDDYTSSSTLLYFCSAFYGFIDGPIQLIARAMIAKLVPSKIQGIAEATRFSVFQGAQVFSGLGLSLASANLTVCMFSIAGLNLVNVIILLTEYKFYVRKSDKTFLMKDTPVTDQ